MKFFFLVLFWLFRCLLSAQEPFQYRFDKDFLSSSFYKNRREEVRKQMPDSSIAILFPAPERLYSNDVNYVYHQLPDFYYLTGFIEPDAILIILKNKITVEDFSFDELLFIAPRNKEKETWTGRLPNLMDASEITGIEFCFLTMDYNSFPLNDSMFTSILYGEWPKGMIDSKRDTLDLFSLVDLNKKKFSHPNAKDDNYKLSSILDALREVKQKEEMVLMRKAITISCEAHKQMMRELKPGMTEYEVQAVGEYVFKKNGSENVGYPSICGGGANSCILHYQSNRKSLVAGDLILLDMGAEYHGYTADVTRTLPVSGKFTTEQEIIYNLVLEAHDSAIAVAKIGNTFQTPHKAAISVIKHGLLRLGIIAQESDYKEYFMHGTSHYLGLDVHDAGTYTLLKEGNVITVEPGIYIAPNSPCDPKWWNIGIRIEDDILITTEGPENLSECCPVLPGEVEKLMAE